MCPGVCHSVQICICHRQKCPGLEDKSFPTPCCLLIQPQLTKRTRGPLSSSALFSVPGESTGLCLWVWEETQAAKAGDPADVGKHMGICPVQPSRAQAGWAAVGGLWKKIHPKAALVTKQGRLTAEALCELSGDCIFFFWLKTLCKCQWMNH